MAVVGNVPWQRGFEAGLGYDIATNCSKMPAVQFRSQAKHEVSDVKVACLLVHSSESYAKALEAYSAVGLSLQGVDCGVTGDLSQSLSINRHQVHAVVMASYQSSGFLRLPDPYLNTEASNILARHGPAVFREQCGDSFIAGYVRGGRFAGVYTLTFESAEQCSSASAGISARVPGVASAASAFYDAMRKYGSMCTSITSSCATGWSASQLPQLKVKNMTPNDLYSQLLEAVKPVDTHVGACLEALLCSYDGVDGYRAALDMYCRSQQPVWRRVLCCTSLGVSKAEQPPAAAGSASVCVPGVHPASVTAARKELGQEVAKLQYLEKMLQAEIDKPCSQSYLQDLKYLKDKVVSAILSISKTFSEPKQCSLLALCIQSTEEAPADARLADWQQGRQLKQKYLQLHQDLEAEIQAVLPKSTSECSSGWLGRHNSAEQCRRINICDGETLQLQCIVPSSSFYLGKKPFGRHAVSHIDGSSSIPIAYFVDNKVLAGFARTSTFISLGMVLVREQSRQQVNSAFSKLQLVNAADLQDVVKVQVLVGSILEGRERKWWTIPGPATIVRQLVFYKGDAGVVRVPDCPDDQLLGAAAGAPHVFPPEGCAGRVTAVSGQGNAIKIHWVPA